MPTATFSVIANKTIALRELQFLKTTKKPRSARIVMLASEFRASRKFMQELTL
jgi:hypothetical protein